ARTSRALSVQHHISCTDTRSLAAGEPRKRVIWVLPICTVRRPGSRPNWRKGVENESTVENLFTSDPRIACAPQNFACAQGHVRLFSWRRLNFPSCGRSPAPIPYCVGLKPLGPSGSNGGCLPCQATYCSCFAAIVLLTWRCEQNVHQTNAFLPDRQCWHARIFGNVCARGRPL